MPNSQDDSTALYSIGAAANLTGVAPSTLRTWERRYAALEPTRTSGGGRRYSESDIERIQMLRTLTEAGEAISVAAELDGETLRQRVQALRGGHHPNPDPTGPVHAILLHGRFAAQLAASGETGIVVRADARSAIQLARWEGEAPDLLLADLELLGSEPEATLERVLEATGAAQAVVEYTFARRAVLSALVDQGARVVRGPLSATDLAQLVRGQGRAKPQPPSPVPSPTEPIPHRFDTVQLARLRELNPELPCECPNHMATLVTSLVAFEDYSRRCADQSPADAEFHRHLGLSTGRARTILESLLFELCEHDGLAV